MVADEPVSALDVSIQAQVLNLMMDLKDELGLTLLFVSHDLKVIEHFCDRVLVMYLGFVVEELRCEELHERAQHPYTKALLGANPINDPSERRDPDRPPGRRPEPLRPPAGLPLRQPLPDRRGALPKRDAAAGDEVARPPGRLLGGRVAAHHFLMRFRYATSSSYCPPSLE